MQKTHHLYHFKLVVYTLWVDLQKWFNVGLGWFTFGHLVDKKRTENCGFWPDLSMIFQTLHAMISKEVFAWFTSIYYVLEYVRPLYYGVEAGEHLCLLLHCMMNDDLVVHHQNVFSPKIKGTMKNVMWTDTFVHSRYTFIIIITVETLYSTIYYSKYFIELNFDKSTQYVALWTHKRHPIPRPFGRAMECLLWVLEQKLIVL